MVEVTLEWATEEDTPELGIAGGTLAGQAIRIPTAGISLGFRGGGERGCMGRSRHGRPFRGKRAHGSPLCTPGRRDPMGQRPASERIPVTQYLQGLQAVNNG